MTGIVAGSSFPVQISVAGVNLTSAVNIWFAIAWRVGEVSIRPPKTKAGGDITVSYDAATGKSTLSLVLSAMETAGLTQDVAYTVFVDDNSPGGEWVPDNGGFGTLRVSKTVKRA